MRTLIVPCAGKSSRFSGMKPKWMLTHPDGKLMLEKALSGFESVDKIIITIVKEHDEKYDASLILRQVFAENKKISICILDDFTKSASETVYRTLEKEGVTGAFIIKDSDNYVEAEIPDEDVNFVVGYDIDKHKDVTNIPGKSFLKSNEQGIILDIVEKKIVSNVICLGVYGFKSVKEFKDAFLSLQDKGIEGELYVSHVISYMLSNKNYISLEIKASAYNDWGTLTEWKKEQQRFRTYFVDVDGVILKNSGRYGKINWSNNKVALLENVAELKRLQSNGAQIVITTSRTDDFRKDLENILANLGIKPYAILTGMNHSSRVVINDFAPTNPYPSAIAINVHRNSEISPYLE